MKPQRDIEIKTGIVPAMPTPSSLCGRHRYISSQKARYINGEGTANAAARDVAGS